MPRRRAVRPRRGDLREPRRMARIRPGTAARVSLLRRQRPALGRCSSPRRRTRGIASSPRPRAAPERMRPGGGSRAGRAAHPRPRGSPNDANLLRLHSAVRGDARAAVRAGYRCDRLRPRRGLARRAPVDPPSMRRGVPECLGGACLRAPARGRGPEHLRPPSGGARLGERPGAVAWASGTPMGEAPRTRSCRVPVGRAVAPPRPGNEKATSSGRQVVRARAEFGGRVHDGEVRMASAYRFLGTDLAVMLSRLL